MSTLPIIPTAAWALAQGLGQGLGAYGEAKQAAQDRTRRQDMENIALWSQLLPALSSYQAPQTVPINTPLLQGNVPVPEMFKSPDAPSPIAASLKRVTGQTSLGLMPSTQAEMRRGALAAKTFDAEAAQPGLQNQAAELNIARGKIGLKADQYDINTKPGRDATAYALTVAPSYVNAAMTAGLPPTAANKDKIVQAAYQRFLQSDQSQWRDKVAPELFAKAVGDEIDQAEKMGLEWYHAKTSRISAEHMNDPWKYVQMSADNYGAEAGRMAAERSRLISSIPQMDRMMMGQDPNYKSQDPNVNSAIESIRAIDQQMQPIVDRRQQLQNMLDKQFAGMRPMEAQPPAGAAPTQDTISQHRAALQAIISTPLASRASIQAYLSSRKRAGLLSDADEATLKAEFLDKKR